MRQWRRWRRDNRCLASQLRRRTLPHQRVKRGTFTIHMRDTTLDTLIIGGTTYRESQESTPHDKFDTPIRHVVQAVKRVVVRLGLATEVQNASGTKSI